MRLRTIDIHGGITDAEIVDWMNERLAEVLRMVLMLVDSDELFYQAAQIQHPLGKLIVFFDEVNTCNCMGLFKGLT